jgi:hypothetical protein
MLTLSIFFQGQPRSNAMFSLLSISRKRFDVVSLYLSIFFQGQPRSNVMLNNFNMLTFSIFFQG